MEKINGIILLAVGIFAAQLAQAQGTLYLSNMGETPGGSVAVGSDAWGAGRFRTGTNSSGYALNSVQLLMDAASGSPSGFAVSIYRSLPFGGIPISLGSLIGSDPAAGGVFTYASSGITLSSSTDYLVLVTAAAPVAQGSYLWSYANTTSYDSSDGWFKGPSYNSSDSGSSWSRYGFDIQFAINATAVPELHIVLNGQRNPVIYFQTFSNQQYSVEYSPDLSSGSWTNLPNGSISGDGNDAQVTDTNVTMSVNRFYRLKLSP